MGLVRRYSEINRSAGEEATNGGDDGQEKSWFTRKVYRAPARRAARGRRWQWGRGERARRTGPAIYVSISWRARVRRDSHPGWTADGGLVRRGHLPADLYPPSSLGASVQYWHRAQSGAPEDAPGDPTPFQASALLQHSRVMLLDPGDPRGWLYSRHAGKTAASDGVTKGLACIAIYRALMINRRKRAASRGFNDRKLEGYERLRI